MDFVADSHELAHKDLEIKGVVQTGRHTGTRNIGWHRPNTEIPGPLIGDIPNGKLWAMIRRFNKNVLAVRALPLGAAQGLDLNEAWAETHASDKLILHLQRAYLSIGLDLASFMKQISRLRSWKETSRTTCFCFAYIVAWVYDMLVPVVLGIFMMMAGSPKFRHTLFPPAPLALVNTRTGGLQNPPAKQLGTTNTITGAPEKQEGEGVEEEAAKFVDNLRHLVMRAVGMHVEEGGGDGNPLEGKVPKPLRNALKEIKAEGSAPGHATESTEQTQEPMENVIWATAKPQNISPILQTIPQVVGDIVDNWERLSNAISPITPISKFSFIRIELLLLPMFLMSCLISYYVVYKVIGFLVGLALFGDPIVVPLLNWLNRRYPKWLDALELKNNVLRGIPTNNQLTLTLLRIGEVYTTPIPPVPSSEPQDPDQELKLNVGSLPFGASDREVEAAIQPPPTDNILENKQDHRPKHKLLSKIVPFFKSNIRVAVEAELAVDHVRAFAGSEKAKGYLGILPNPKDLIYSGPSEFKARFDGKNGWVRITEEPNPRVLFSAQRSKYDLNTEPVANGFNIQVNNITQLKRTTASTSKVLEKAADLADREKLGSVEIRDQSGKVWRLTALPERDELFNRLISVGGQRWEII